MQPINFSKIFLGPRIRYLDRYKYPKKTIFEFFPTIFDFKVPVPKAKKWYFSDLVLKVNSDYLKNKNLIFRLWYRYLKVRNCRKKFKKSFLWVFIPIQIPYFWIQKLFEKFTGCIWYLVLPLK
jgi:hypothetical protein